MKILYFLIVCFISTAATAQVCNPADHDWGGALFGVSPDPTIGENFVPGYLNMPYNDQVYVKAPSSVADVDSTFAGIQLAIDSISLDSITFFNGLSEQSVSLLGLSVTCNNGGDSPNPCMFMPGNAYCGDISGIPNAVGSFPVKIHVTVYFVFFSSQAIAYTFEGYTLDVLEDIAVLESSRVQSIASLQNFPNPANNSTNIKFELGKADQVTLSITNLMGKKVLDKNLIARKGENTAVVNTEEFASGIYLYSITSGDKKITKRMLVQH